ncbi:MAG: uroporphyrinogen-III synthase, partial [Acidimicrobiia bacterium]|nr:uroporphyrinogen-III synthase [Acidimicrobiia bacterium]
GLVPVMLPCISISPATADVLAELRTQADSADLILLTSARTVRIMWPDGNMPPVPAAVVGSATAEAVVEAGGTVEVVGSGGAGELVEELTVEGRTIVFPHARAADPATAEHLEERGAVVHAAAAYDTIPISPGDDKVDAAVFGSPSAVDGWLTRRHLEGMTIAAMGPTTASALRVRGVADPVVPDRPELSVLARALAERINS